MLATAPSDHAHRPHPFGGGALVPAADRPLADLALVLAHRIRSLVGGIQAAGEALADSASAADRPLVFDVLEGAAAIEGVLADLLRYAHEFDLVRQPLCLAALAADLPAALAPIDGARVRLGACGPAPIVGDPFLLRQAALALVQNALEAAPGATVALAVEAGPETAALTVTQPGALGVEPAERVFDPFFTTKPQHLGLGLPLARRIAAAHGGKIGVSPSYSSDSVTFRLIVPMTPSPPVDPA